MEIFLNSSSFLSIVLKSNEVIHYSSLDERLAKLNCPPPPPPFSFFLTTTCSINALYLGQLKQLCIAAPCLQGHTLCLEWEPLSQSGLKSCPLSFTYPDNELSYLSLQGMCLFKISTLNIQQNIICTYHFYAHVIQYMYPFCACLSLNINSQVRPCLENLQRTELIMVPCVKNILENKL